jgi:ATP-dependent RNA helicase RhlB
VRFEELQIPEPVLKGIRAANFTECTQVQELTLPEILRGADVAAQAQTGTGKTAAFLIGIFSQMNSTRPPGPGMSPRVLIIAPTRELVVQIEPAAKLLGRPSGYRIMSVFGGVDYRKQRDQLSRGVDVLIGTPGRLIDYLKQKVYRLKRTQFLVIDEADRMFNMGFISDLRFLLRRMSPYNKRQSLLFSATLTTRVLLGILRSEPGGRYLIFCNMKVTSEKLKDSLNANGHKSAAITGSLDQRRRLRVLSQFRNGEIPILVATDVAGRGLHIEGVTHVINYDLPQDADDYVHRIGRTARAGAVGKAISIACENYVTSLHDIEEYIKQKLPAIHVTDDMIATDYKEAPKRKTSVHPRRKSTHPKHRKKIHLDSKGPSGHHKTTGSRHQKRKSKKNPDQPPRQ